VLKLIIGIIGSLFFIGCASKDLANHYVKENKLQKAHSIYESWAKRGDKESILKLAKLETNTTKKIEYALRAYNEGERYGANILEKVYFNQHNIKKAQYWYERADLNNSTYEDFKTHLDVILTFNDLDKELRELEKIEKISSTNLFANRALGEFYEGKNRFFDLKKSEFFYKKGYEKGDIKAGIKLAFLYINKLHKEKKGFSILEEISNSDLRSAYILAKFLVDRMERNLISFNTPCITCSFKTSYEFFNKKLYLIKYRDKFIYKNIKPLLDRAYSRGFLKAKLFLIKLDLKYDKFLSSKTYSGFSLKEAINFLENQDNIEAKLLLAQIYERYTFLNKYKLAKKIYLDYALINKVDAFWRLYNYSKKFENNKKDIYLSYLKKEHFMSAIIEEAYLKKDIKTLYRYSKNNELALKYYTFLTSKSCKGYKRLCRLFPLDKELDLKIASLIEKNSLFKSATIYKFYADLGDLRAKYKLLSVYKRLCQDKFLAYLKKFKDSDNNIKVLYAKEVIKGFIKDDKEKYFSFLKEEADKNNIEAVKFLANLYADGFYVDFDMNKAIYYYNKAISLGDKNSYYELIDLYKKINFNHKFDTTIIKFYKLAIKNNLPNSKANLAEFYISLGDYYRAKKILRKDLKNPKSRYLYFKLTGKYYHIKSYKTNYGKSLLAKAKRIGRFNPYRALLYSFRASLCNTSGAVLYSYEMMKRINNSKTIEKIYKKAKSYPKCRNY